MISNDGKSAAEGDDVTEDIRNDGVFVEEKEEDLGGAVGRAGRTGRESKSTPRAARVRRTVERMCDVLVVDKMLWTA